MALIYNGKNAKLDGNFLFTKDYKTNEKIVIHISDIKKEYDTLLNIVKYDPINANIDSDKLYELLNILNEFNKL